MSDRPRVPLAIVHHANQYLITDGYDNRAGIGAVLAGYSAALDLHEELGVPAALHLSGTLIEAAAWHRPAFLDRVAALAAAGAVELVGGAYGENVMPLFPAGFNRLQLREWLAVAGRHLGPPAAATRLFWVPERVWSTPRLAPVLADRDLPNGGYRHVLVDDRLLVRSAPAYAGSPREAFDRAGPFGDRPPEDWLAPDAGGDPGLRPAVVAGGEGLVAVPVSTALRYLVPPPDDDGMEGLRRACAGLGAAPPLLVYADDLEKTVGVAGWRPALDRYAAALRWLGGPDSAFRPVALGAWLAAAAPAAPRPVDPGAFVELEQGWGAGPGYRGWHRRASWARHRRRLAVARRAVGRADGADARLVELAQKHLLASTHETAWHEFAGAELRPARWAEAHASHARSCLPLLRAAQHLARRGVAPAASVVDVDDDGRDEVVLVADGVHAVVSPREGGRVVQLAVRGPDGAALVVGNPTDHWNFQRKLNRYMDVPPAHPGGLADRGHEHDRWRVEAVGDGAVGLIDETPGPLWGARKTIRAEATLGGLAVRYRLPAGAPPLTVVVCLSPDYLALLREGRAALRRVAGAGLLGAEAGGTTAWVGRVPGEATALAQDGEAPHGVVVALTAHAADFGLVIGSGAPARWGRVRRDTSRAPRPAGREETMSVNGSVRRGLAATPLRPCRRGLSQRRVLVTGGLGFIGSSVTEALAAAGHHVTVVDSGVSSVAGPDELDVPAGAVEHVPRTVAGYLQDEPLLAGAELVVHTASHVGPASILRYAGSLGSAIVRDTAAVIDACLAAGVPLVDFSSAEVYGKSGMLVEDSDVRVPARYNPRIEYALGKLTCEAMCVNSRTRGLRAVVLRPFNVAGPRQSSAGGFVLPTFVQQALASRPITVFAGGGQKRAFLSVTDLCRFVTEHLDEAAFDEPRVVNVGNPGNTTTIVGLAHAVRDRLGSTSEIVFTDGATVYGPLYQEAESYEKLPDIALARTYGWEPRVGLDELIDETARHYARRPDPLGAGV